MKTCPYCAEEIKDEAIRCRWCQAWLVDEIPAGADGPARTPAGATSASSEGSTTPATTSQLSAQTETAKPTEATPAPVQAAPAATTFQTAPAQAAPVQAAPAQAAPAQAAPAAAPVETKTEFTHTGSRFLLGYGGDFFGIWDRNAPQQPIERFPRNDQGWATAWARYASIEPNWMDLRTGQKSG